MCQTIEELKSINQICYFQVSISLEFHTAKESKVRMLSAMWSCEQQGASCNQVIPAPLAQEYKSDLHQSHCKQNRSNNYIQKVLFYNSSPAKQTAMEEGKSGRNITSAQQVGFFNFGSQRQ